MKPEIILALDVGSVRKAKYFVSRLHRKINIFKVGPHLFTEAGPEIIKFINKKGAKVFLDLKLFDIPNTVANAVRAAVRLKVKMLTLHILGDEEMLKAAVEAARDESARRKYPRPLLIGVTILTSSSASYSDVSTLARIGLESGLDGIVCSAKEAPLLRKEIKKKFLIVTPGIRPEGGVLHDQKRVVTAQEAIQAGSNFLVVGRPVLEAKDPLRAASEMVDACKKAHRPGGRGLASNSQSQGA